MNKIITGIFCLIISFVFIGIGAYVQFFRTAGYETTQATITQIEHNLNTNASGHRNRGYTVYIEYEVDGQTYSGPSDVWQSGMVKGQRITVHYNPNNPSELAADPGWMGWFTLGIGALAVLGSLGIMFKKD